MAFSSAVAFAESGNARTFTGEIMDSSCAKMGSHEMMEKEHKVAHDAKACTLGCVKMGAKFVLYDTATKPFTPSMTRKNRRHLPGKR